MSNVRTIYYSTLEDTFARVLDLKVRIRRRRADGPKILLLNGLGGCVEAWAPVTSRLDGYDLIAVDHPGTGLSSPPNRLLSKFELAAFYASVLDLLEVETTHLLGFSFGGTIAQQFAFDYPQRVESLILASSTPGVGGIPPEPTTIMASTNPWRHQIALVREMAAPFLYRGRAGRNPRLFQDELAGFHFHRATMLGIAAQLASDSGWSSLPFLASLDVPTLVLCGEEDPMTRVGNSEIIAAAIPGAVLRTYAEAGHLLIFDEPDEPLRDINAFLTRVREDAPARARRLAAERDAPV